MTATTLLLLTLNLGLHAAFIWGRYAVFRIDGPTPPGVRLIEGSAIACILLGAGLVATRDAGGAIVDVAAVVVAATSAGLFAWGVRTVGPKRLTAAFSDDVPIQLIAAGPFRYVRNPFYLAYLLAYAQAAITSRSPWAALAVAWMACIYRRAARLEERKFLLSELAETYRRYADRTGRFLPLPGSSPRSEP